MDGNVLFMCSDVVGFVKEKRSKVKVSESERREVTVCCTHVGQLFNCRDADGL